MSTRPVALVTGASSGIGRAFAVALAERGHDLVVVARDETRLKDLATTLAVDVEVLAADLATDEGVAATEQRLGAGVDLLVNNAGFGTSGRFAELPIDEEDREIRLNVLALTRLTHAALPSMLSAHKGGILNVASIAGLSPSPGNATYGATKAYVVSFTQAIRAELRGTGVKALALCPGFTRTEFQQRAGYNSSHIPSFLWQSAERVVATALKDLDRDTGICVPGIANKVTAAGTHLVPRRALARVAGMISSQV
jgi:short-subunit dehydrogenase